MDPDNIEQTQAILDTIVMLGFEKTMTNLLVLAIDHDLPVTACCKNAFERLSGMVLKIPQLTKEEAAALMHEGGVTKAFIVLPDNDDHDLDTTNPEMN